MIKNFKIGEEIVCINNVGILFLTVGKTYVVLNAYKEYGRFHVMVNGVCVFSERFTNLRMERQRKLLKLENEHKNL